MPTVEQSRGRSIGEAQQLHRVYLVELVDHAKELNAALARKRLPVSSGGIGPWVRWETSPPLPRIPREVRSAADRQRFLAHSQRTEAIPDVKGLLIALLNVRRAPSAEVDEASRRFIEQWGAFELCTHLRPAGHCDASRVLTIPERGAVPVAAIRFYSELFADLMSLYATGDFGRFDAESALLRFHASVGDFAPGFTDYMLFVSGALNVLMDDAALRPVLRWDLTVVVGSHSPLLSALILQVSDAIRALPDHRECTGCGLLVDLSARQRPPSEGENVWCASCREAGVHKRHSEKTKRAERRAAQGHGQVQTS